MRLPHLPATLLLVSVAAFVASRAAETMPSSPPVPAPAPLSTTPPAAIDISKCYGPFRSESFLEVAAVLQALPEAQRVAKLQAWANDEALGFRDQVIELCRMLFEPKPGQNFRDPGSGVPVFVGLGDGGVIALVKLGAQWPREPIALVNDIPFKVVRGYSIAGAAPESAPSYLKYCLDETLWTAHRYAPSSAESLQKALDRLVRETAWPEPIEKVDPRLHDLGFLSDQIRPYEPPPLRVDSILVTTSTGGHRAFTNATGELKVDGQLAVEPSGGYRPYRYTITRQSVAGGPPKLLTQGEGRSDIADPFRVEQIRVPWPVPAAVVGDQVIFTLTDAKGAQMVQVLKVTGPSKVEIARPIAGQASANPTLEQVLPPATDKK